MVQQQMYNQKQIYTPNRLTDKRSSVINARNEEKSLSKQARRRTRHGTERATGKFNSTSYERKKPNQGAPRFYATAVRNTAV